MGEFKQNFLHRLLSAVSLTQTFSSTASTVDAFVGTQQGTRNSAPVFSPDLFTSGENCYAYALNRPKEDEYFNPGVLARLSGEGYVHFDHFQLLGLDRISDGKFKKIFHAAKHHIQSEVERDGLIPIKNKEDFNGKQGYIVALAMKDHYSTNEPGHSDRKREIDYHWYRQDADGTWSHKTRSKPPTNKDASGKIITNPRTADRGDYEHFIGFYFVPKALGTAHPRATVSMNKTQKQPQKEPE